jgi:O-antigen ligase
MTVLLGGVTGLVAVLGVWALFYRLERRTESSAAVVTILLAILVMEAALYPDPNNVPDGLFHPEIGGLSFRIFDVLIPLALAARLAVRRPPRSLPITLLLWGAFIAWLACAGVIGLVEGSPPAIVAFQAKAILYLGLMALALDVPPDGWLAPRRLRFLIGLASFAAAALIATDQASVMVSLDLPLLPLSGFGPVGSDAATIFAGLGVIALVLGVCSASGRTSLLIASGPLLLAPAVADQRAALLGLLVSLVAVAAFAPLAWRHLRATGTEVTLAVVAVAAVLVIPTVATAALGSASARVPFAETLQETFRSRGKQLSGQERVNQWDEARALVSERPVLGWGLGKQYHYYSPGFFEFKETDLTHNILGDLMLRTGVVGVLLFLAAAFASLGDALATWRRSLDPRVAALGLACFGALAGLIAKGMVESLFEKYRLAIFMGLLVGMSAGISFAWRGRLESLPLGRSRPAALPAGEALP